MDVTTAAIVIAGIDDDVLTAVVAIDVAAADAVDSVDALAVGSESIGDTGPAADVCVNASMELCCNCRSLDATLPCWKDRLLMLLTAPNSSTSAETTVNLNIIKLLRRSP